MARTLEHQTLPASISSCAAHKRVGPCRTIGILLTKILSKHVQKMNTAVYIVQIQTHRNKAHTSYQQTYHMTYATYQNLESFLAFPSMDSQRVHQPRRLGTMYPIYPYLGATHWHSSSIDATKYLASDNLERAPLEGFTRKHSPILPTIPMIPLASQMWTHSCE